MTKDQNKRSRHGLKVLCWNMQHSRDKHEGVKADIPEIKQLISSHDIFALQETKGEINISEYHCYNSNRAGSNSGGVCIGVHKSLKAGVSRVRVDSTEDIVIVKLKANFFDLEKDTNLINVYDSPNQGSFKKRKKTEQHGNLVSTLELLQEILADIPISEDNILLGDFNARTGVLDDTLSYEVHHNDDPQILDQYCPTLPKRNTKDLKLNSNGRPFIETLQTSGLSILNGRTLGDIFGDITCVQPQGVSVVDYICVSPSMFNKIRYFKVGSKNTYSDHKPLSMLINTNPLLRLSQNLDITAIDAAPQPFKWTRSESPLIDTSKKFLAAQKELTFSENIRHLIDCTVDPPNKLTQFNKDVINIYTQLAKSVTSQKSGKRTNKKNGSTGAAGLLKGELIKQSAKLIKIRLISHPAISSSQ